MKGRFSGLVLLAHWHVLVLSVNVFAAAGSFVRASTTADWLSGACSLWSMSVQLRSGVLATDRATMAASTEPGLGVRPRAKVLGRPLVEVTARRKR